MIEIRFKKRFRTADTKLYVNNYPTIAMNGLIAVGILLATGLAIWRARRRSGLAWFDFLIMRGAWVYSRLWHRWSAAGSQRITPTGPALLISNHSCSADPNFLLAAANRPIGFLTAREHYNLHPFARKILDRLGCIPVVRAGADITALRTAVRRLEQGWAVGIFPEGNLSGVARQRLRRPKAGMALIALISRAPVYPIYISGGPRTHRLLPSWVLPTPRAARVHIGPPIDLARYYHLPRTRQLIEEVASLLINNIEAMNPKHGLHSGISLAS